MASTNPDDYLVLHSRERLAADGAPALTERFLSHLDRSASSTSSAAPPTLTPDEARARLVAEHPKWWECVELCCQKGLTEREAAAWIGVSPALAHRRKARGLERLAAWCGQDDAGDVALLLRHRRPSWAS